jgi:hypothetical protein
MIKIKTHRLIHKIKYLEILNSKGIYYRIYAEYYKNSSKKKNPTYGLEVTSINDNKTDYISSYSENIQKAVKFCDYLVKNTILPQNLSDAALNFLADSIDEKEYCSIIF